MHNSVINEAPSDFTSSLLNAFTVFQNQCVLLEESHNRLQSRLNNSQLTLARKNEELASRISEVENMKKRLTGILKSITDAVVLIDLSGNIEMMNPAARRLFGDSKYIDFSSNWPELSTYLQTETTLRDIDIRRTHECGNQLFMVSIIPMTVTGDTDPLKVICLKDVTEHRQLQQQVAREDRLAALGKVSASVAHEIRNPLGGIEGFARLLERELDDQPIQKQLATKIVFAARQLNAVVSNLLNYSREINSEFAIVNLGLIVEEVANTLRLSAEDRKIDVDLRIPSRPICAEVNAVQIKQVMTNLIVNALEACPRDESGRIAIEVTDSTSHVSISVSDNGSGISKPTLSRIFEPFFTTKDGGIGLGLALCQRLIETHNGTITCESEVEKGSVFYIKIRKKRD